MTLTVFWACTTLLCLMIHAFFTMSEMACVSFNKVRLEYYAAKGKKRALWLNTLLKNPSRLFGTTLLGVNAALQVGSECSRQLYESLELSPDLAPITQVVLVLIFAELSPMFAARRHAEHVALLAVPVIYACSKLAYPWIRGITMLSHYINYLIGGKEIAAGTFLSRDELQNVIEDQEDSSGIDQGKDFNVVVSNIFSLRNKTARQVMESLDTIQMVPASSTVGHMRQLLRQTYYPHIPVYHRSVRNIIKIAYPRDLINQSDDVHVLHHARQPWFLAQHTKILEILQQFRRNKQGVAVVLDRQGMAVGILTLDDILDEIFGKQELRLAEALRYRPKSKRVIERSFPATLTIEDFNRQFDAELDSQGAQTLGQLMIRMLGHPPQKGESVRVQDFLLTAEESTIMGAKTVAVRSLLN